MKEKKILTNYRNSKYKLKLKRPRSNTDGNSLDNIINGLNDIIGNGNIKSISNNGCIQFNENELEINSVNGFNGTMFLGWYLKFENLGMEVKYAVYKYSERNDTNNIIFNSSFRIKSEDMNAGYD